MEECAYAPILTSDIKSLANGVICWGEHEAPHHDQTGKSGNTYISDERGT